MTNLVILEVDYDMKWRTVNLHCAEDSRVSYGAKGLHLYLSSRPKNWKLNKQDLLNRSTNGRDAVNAFIKELKFYGYLRIEDGRDEEGQFMPKWVVSHFPSNYKGYGDLYQKNDIPHTGKPSPENQCTGKPGTGKPGTGNQPLKEEHNTYEKNQESIEEIICAFCKCTVLDDAIFHRKTKQWMCQDCKDAESHLNQQPDQPATQPETALPDFEGMFDDLWRNGGWRGTPNRQHAKAKYFALLKRIRKEKGLYIKNPDDPDGELILSPMPLVNAHQYLLESSRMQFAFTERMTRAGLFVPEMPNFSTWIAQSRWEDRHFKNEDIAHAKVSAQKDKRPGHSGAPKVMNKAKASMENLNRSLQKRGDTHGYNGNSVLNSAGTRKSLPAPNPD